MTAEIRKAVRRNRKRGVAAVLAGVAVVALVLVVVPAFAAVGDPIPPASSPGNVTPTEINNGGQDNDCAFVGSSAPISWRIENPTTSTRTQTFNGKQVTLALKVTSGGKTLEFTVTGAVARDVVVKGGTNSAWYRYNPARTTDGNLHAPKKSGSTLYAISHTTFCLAQVGTISGTVFKDDNESGAQDPFESAQNGWTVSLYGNGGVVTTQTTTIGGVAGSYKFADLPLGVEYTVCETPPPNSGSWGQTVPSGNTYCTASGEEPAGQRVLLNSPAATAHFGNVPTATATCAAPSGIPGAYEFSVVCASKLVGQEFVVSAWQDGGQFVNLHPVGSLSGASISIAEKIYFDYPSDGQNALTVKYDDTKPYGDADTKVMRLCTYDPLAPGEEFVFADGFDPVANPVLPVGETSCMIRNSEVAGGKYVALVYTEQDGWRVGVG